jgi:hypothetical protein
MDQLRGDLLTCLQGISPAQAVTPIYSTVRGGIVDGRDLDAGYWADNLRQPVLFSGQIARLAAESTGVFVEISPHPILLPAVEQVLVDGGADAVVLPSLRKHEPGRDTLLRSAGALYVLGARLSGRVTEAGDGHRLRRESLAFGALMNARGLTELVFLSVGRDLGVISPRMFTVMVLMAVVTTAITHPVLRLLGVVPPRAAQVPDPDQPNLSGFATA